MSINRRKRPENDSQYDERGAAVDEAMRPIHKQGDSMAVSSSLHNIHISPRTPKTPKTSQFDEAEEGVELSLLNEEERYQAARDFDDMQELNGNVKHPISSKDKRAMVLLCILCKSSISYLCYYSEITRRKDLIQGVPVCISFYPCASLLTAVSTVGASSR